MAKSFLPTQVRISQSACACRSREEQVMHRWPQAVVRWAIGGGVWQKVCAVSKALTRVFFLCWISSHGWRKLEDNGQMIPSPQSLFHCFFYSLRLSAHCGRSLHAWGVILTLLLLSLFFFTLFLLCSDLHVCRLPEVCWSRDLAWVSGCCHTVWYHYGSTWCLHEVMILYFLGPLGTGGMGNTPLKFKETYHCFPYFLWVKIIKAQYPAVNIVRHHVKPYI